MALEEMGEEQDLIKSQAVMQFYVESQPGADLVRATFQPCPRKGSGPCREGGRQRRGTSSFSFGQWGGLYPPLSRESHANVLFARGLCAPARVPQPTIGGRRCGVTLSIWPPPRKPRFSIVSRRESKRWRRMDANARLCLLLICRMRRLETLRFQTLNRTLVQCSS